MCLVLAELLCPHRFRVMLPSGDLLGRRKVSAAEKFGAGLGSGTEPAGNGVPSPGRTSLALHAAKAKPSSVAANPHMRADMSALKLYSLRLRWSLADAGSINCCQ